MHATVCLMTCALVLAQQPGERTEWLLVPRLDRGQELVYRGTCSEEILGKGVRLDRGYRVEARAFVLDTPARGLDVAFLTVLKRRAAPAARGEDPGPSSVRLELGKVDLQGRLNPGSGSSLAVPLDGPATVEAGVFVEAPRGRVGLGKSWESAEEGRPKRTWRVVGTEVVNGATCLKVEGVQQSDDWDRPRADRTAWRRRDLVWVAPKLGVAYRVERILERRMPAREEPTRRSVTRYELESSLQYPGQLFEDRRREILAARQFQESALPLLPHPNRNGPKPLDNLLTRIARHLETQPPTPYREAVIQVRRRVEAARRGEASPAPPAEDAVPVPAAAEGQKAPDFVTTNLLTKESARLKKHLGKPMLMVFYSPNSSTVVDVLGFAQKVANSHPGRVTVLGFAVSDDAERVRRQHEELHLQFPILSGTGLRLSYGVEATPKLIVLDPEGTIRASYVGWGQETPEGVTAELKRWLRR